MSAASAEGSVWLRRRHALGIAALLAAFALSAATRVVFPLRDPNVRGASAAALLRTDPAFLYYVTERVVENGGAFPAELRADPNLEWPDLTDVAAIETVGQELYLAWTYLAFGKPMPLVRWAWIAMSVWASLVAVGVYGIAYELTGKVRWAALAALLWAVMLGNYRTLGFVLVREDFAFPWIAAHFWLALRAARTRGWASIALAGLTLLAAAATWHASVFVLLIEAACLLAWFLRSGENPFDERRAWLALAIAIAGSLAVPVLRAKQFALSPPVLIAVALGVAALAGRSRPMRRAAKAGVALVALGLLALGARAVGGGGEDYGHVFALLAAKLRYLGVPPADPRGLDFGVRLLWQGPFRTADATTFVPLLTAGVAASVAAAFLFAPAWWRGRDARAALALAFVAATALATWLVERTAPLFGLVSAAAAALVLDRLPSARFATLLAIAAVAAHGAHQIYVHSTYAISWYALPSAGAEQEDLMRWIRANVPAGEPIAADYSTSAAILAHTRHPILNQPKYETRRSRDKIGELCRAYYESTPAELARFLAERGCRWLVVNRPFLGGNATDLGGILPRDLPQMRHTACWLTMSDDPREYAAIPGLKLVYESPAALRMRSYRVYRAE